jgi:hypothetical protein
MDLLTRRVLVLGFMVVSITLLLYAGFNIRWSKMFSPGPLATAHKELDKKGQCSACHTKGKRLDNSRCLDCHKEIRARIEQKSGLHARVSTECSLCHSEHHGRSYNLRQLDVKTFDHAMTGWPIEGKHVLLKCEACHKKGPYLLEKRECVHCHQDIHKGENGQECSECHTAEKFTDVK